MRVRQWIVGTATTTFVACVGFAGCGGSTTSPSPVQDASVDVNAPDAPRDVVAQDAPADVVNVCETDADITALDVPDAAIGDSGANAAGCAACTRSKCSSQLRACNDECACNVAISRFFACLGRGDAPQSCFPEAISGGDKAIGLGQCVFQGCASDCGVGGFLDAGPRDGASDATSDAPRDAPAEGG